MEQAPTISEKTRVSLAVLLVVVPILYAFAGDHFTLTSLARDRDEMRADVKEIKEAVQSIQLQMARRDQREREQQDTRHR